MARQNKQTKVNNFRISLVNDESHKQLWGLRFTRSGLLVLIITIVVVDLALVFSLIAFTPVRTAIPGYPNAHTRREAIQNAIRIDSLENIIMRWELYSENLARVVDGREPVKIDSIIKASEKLDLDEIRAQELAKMDTLLREIVREEDQFDVSGDERKLPVEGMHFFVPLKGVITAQYDNVLHPYIDISAPANSVVMSVLDGTVILADWDDTGGYTIGIQHENDLISIYRHNEKLLKKVGDKVVAGTSIGLVGTSDSMAKNDHLHFELWYKGETLDPARYILF